MKHRVLIVDDQRDTALVLQEYFVDNGLSADVALNGSEAVGRCRTRKYDVLLVDFKLPDFDGVAVVEHCLEYLPNVRVIYLTGYDMQLKRHKSPVNPSRIIEKPCRPAKILACIEDLLGNAPPGRTYS
ncbi:MAG: response regulator [bacterium]